MRRLIHSSTNLKYVVFVCVCVGVWVRGGGGRCLLFQCDQAYNHLVALSVFVCVCVCVCVCQQSDESDD